MQGWLACPVLIRTFPKQSLPPSSRDWEQERLIFQIYVKSKRFKGKKLEDRQGEEKAM